MRDTILAFFIVVASSQIFPHFLVAQKYILFLKPQGIFSKIFLQLKQNGLAFCLAICDSQKLLVEMAATK
ncbi:MAG: hypothetical protein MJZ98_07500 [Paludibacteraceae bacterium]|nr:hypothetical protein [Paludibacteraceae bacterium]